MPTKKTTTKKTVKKVVERSDEYKKFEQLIADYKEQNPTKYELKKDELEAQLKSLE